HFKAINDRYGHAAGDTVLVEVARRLAALAQPHGEVIRWGGEEFLVVLRAAGAIAVGRAVRAMLEAIAEQRVLSGEDALRVRASIGFTICLPPVVGVAEHIDQIVARADRALYHAKETGRARAVGAEIDRETGELRLREVAAL
ncbi:MAG TPA: GGDEF domain-containing protein, partial [Xanthomonadales bacterium]|nr:GGDEF domain-containing protein [Xanthomonadales bacterium]